MRTVEAVCAVECHTCFGWVPGGTLFADGLSNSGVRGGSRGAPKKEVIARWPKSGALLPCFGNDLLSDLSDCARMALLPEAALVPFFRLSGLLVCSAPPWRLRAGSAALELPPV